MTTKPFDDQLDLARWVGQRSATFRFRRVHGVTNEPLGDITPISNTVPVLSHDTSRTIKRQVTMSLGAADTATIDPVAERITIAMLMKGVEFPLGRYVFTSHNELRYTSGRLGVVTLYDEMFVVDQQLETGFTALGGSVGTDVLRLVTGLPVSVIIDPTDFSSTGSWNAGTTRGQALNALAVQGDYLSPWFANDGKMHVVRTIDPGSTIPALNWDAGSVVFLGSVIETNDLLSAPNRFVVISNSGDAGDAAIVGTYDVPASAPHSVQNRGFIIPDVQDIQVMTTAQATAAARNLGLRQTIFERREIATPPDPRHDSYDVVRWDGVNWLEIAWSMTLIEGGAMSHILRKAYA